MNPTSVKRKGDHTKGPMNLINAHVIDVEDFVITSAQLLALNTTPVTILPAPGTDRAIVVDSVYLYKPAGTAYALNTSTQLQFRYTNGTGAINAAVNDTGFVDQTTAQLRVAFPGTGSAARQEITPVANAPIVVFSDTANLTTGNTPIYGKIYFRIYPAVMNAIPTTSYIYS